MHPSSLDSVPRSPLSFQSSTCDIFDSLFYLPGFNVGFDGLEAPAEAGGGGEEEEEEEEKGGGGMGEVLNSFGHAFLNDGVILQKMILLSVFSSRIKWNWRSSGWWQVNGRHFGNICFGFFRWCETWTLLGKFHAFILCACWLNWMIFSRWFQLFCWQANERKSQHPFHSINGAANLISIKSNDMKKELC